jgi:RNA polymerase sigma-70 factor (ECF subfamily)
MMPLDDSMATRESLLERLKHQSDQSAWNTFFHRYWRFIYNVARRSGLTDAEAQDVVQETVLSVARNIEGFNYDPKECSFKTWMLRVTRWRVLRCFERRQRERQFVNPPSTGHPQNPSLENIPDPAGLALEKIWEEEWQKHLYVSAREQIKRKVGPLSLQIFELHVNQGWSVKEITASLGVSPARVYLAKHRIGRLIRKHIEALQDGGNY